MGAKGELLCHKATWGGEGYITQAACSLHHIPKRAFNMENPLAGITPCTYIICTRIQTWLGPRVNSSLETGATLGASP